MTESAPPFQYVPLSGLRSIRVLILHPARTANHPIRCSLQETSFGEHDGTALRYDALSYTWGASKGTKPILCDGRTILITSNCEQALLHLRLRSRPRNLWIDAICIDQDSLREKNQQVPLMGQIYRHASRTILWLGPDTNNKLSAALRHAARYGSWIIGIKRVYRKVREDMTDRGFEGYWQVPVLSVAETERIVEICANEWFGRMWTIQEFLLSNSAIFLMGHVTCPSPALFTYYCLGKNLVKRPDLEHFRMRNSLKTLMPSSLSGSVSKTFLHSIVKLAALNNSTDPRDKVYGMAAYLERRWPNFQHPMVDYTKSMVDIYESFTRSLITATSSLWPLELIIGCPGPESDALPSWVLDLRDPDRLASDGTFSSPLLACKANGFKFTIQKEKPRQLTVRAKRIGKVVRTSARMPFWVSKSETRSAKEFDLARSTCLSEWTAFVTDLDMHEDPEISPYLQRSSSRDFRDWNSQDGIEDQRANPNTYALKQFTTGLDYLRFRHQAEDEVSIDESPLYFGLDKKKAAKKKATKRRKKWEVRRKEAEKDSSFFHIGPSSHDMCRLFLMSTGHLGDCPGDVCVGDSIYVIQGSTVPFVLRRRGKKYLVVGKARIYRMELEEAWDPTTLDQDREACNIVLV